MLKLFYAPGACSLAAHIVLEEIGLPFDAICMDLAAGDQHKQAYLAVNPHARVPALVTPQGTLTESPAILPYLADTAPTLNLLPTDPFARAQAQSQMSWLSSHLHVAVAHVWRAPRYTDDANGHDGMKTRAMATVAAGFDTLDARVAGRDWVFDGYSVVDPYLLVMRRWGSRLGLDMTAWPNLVAHGDRVAARPATMRALEREGIRIDG